jgi:hypothetical protein
MAGEAAAAFGATAAFIRRTGNMPKIAKGMDMAKDFVSASGNYLPKKAWNDVTFTDTKKMFRDAKSELAKIREDYRLHPVRIDPYSNTSLVGTIHEMNSVLAVPGRTSEAVWRQNTVTAAGRDFMAQNFANLPRTSQEKFNNFISAVSASLDDRRKIAAVRKMAKFDPGEGAISDLLLTHMKQAAASDKAHEATKDITLQNMRSANKQFMKVDNLKKVFGYRKGPNEKSLDFVRKLTKEDDATVGDLLDPKNRDKVAHIPGYRAKKDQQVGESAIEILKNMYKNLKDKDAANHTNEAAEFLKVYVDKGRLKKTDGGELYSFNSPAHIRDKFLDFGAGTLPGQILKLRYFEYNHKAPVFQYIGLGSSDPLLAAAVGNNGKARSSEVGGNYLRIKNNIYHMNENGEANEVKGLEDFRYSSGKFGPGARVLRQIIGDTRYADGGNFITRKLDLFRDREENNGKAPGNGLLSVITKRDDEDWRGNVFKRFLSPTFEQKKAFQQGLIGSDISYSLDYLNKAEHMQNIIASNVFALSREVASQLSKNTTGRAQQLFEALGESDDAKMLDKIMHLSSGSLSTRGDYINADLTNWVEQFNANPQETLNMIRLKDDKEHLNISTSIFDLPSTKGNNQTKDAYEILRTEVAKEAMLQYASQASSDVSKKNYKALIDLVGSLDTDMSKKVEARHMAALAIFQDKTWINERIKGGLTDDGYRSLMNNVEMVMNGSNDEEDKFVRKSFKEVGNAIISPLEQRGEELTLEGPAQYNSWIAMRKMTTPLDFIRSLNDSTKAKAVGKRMFTQFWAGRDNPEDITEATLVPYFMLSRLSDAMNTVGLGFSKESMGSVGQLTKNIMLKRVLPAAVASTYLEWGDDTSQELTGTSVSGAMANGIANIDLASRKVMDTFGLTDWLKGEKSINPIMQYWGGHGEFQSWAERKKYYESGYDPVRKGAWWTFGGVNEARGGEIQYWQPSYARRINSDYEDKALYDGYFDKWSHSWLPTPSNPLSPIRALLNPYWLEEKHADDRPYAISGPLFQQGTPWGAILNPTLGQIIKPQKELHPWRLNNGIDAKNLIHEVNEYIHAKARDLGGQNMIALKGNTATPVRFTSYDAPTEDTTSTSVQTKNGMFSDPRRGVYGVYDGDGGPNPATGFTKFGKGSAAAAFVGAQSGLPGLRDMIRAKLSGGSGQMPVQNGDIMQDSRGNLGVYLQQDKPAPIDSSLNLEDEIAMDRMIRGDMGGIKRTVGEIVHALNPTTIIQRLNDGTKKKAGQSVSLHTATTDEFDTEQGFISPDKLKNYRPSQGMQLLDNPDDMAELVHAGKGYDYVHDAAVSWRLISGIYGYMAGAATGFGVDNRKKVADSSDMTSFSRTFWDSNLGGAGGDIMEIARRFIPDFRRSNRVSPLMNEMPDWLPERFKYGDPYTLLPKGEMRLPGKGYLALNKLHPDQFGTYGAYDRFKILADIAPMTPEYKMWRTIAQKTVTDPDLKEDMDDIRQRVSQQGKKHDFYEYKSVGHGLDYETVTVSSVLGYGKFRSGSSIYKVAGVKVRGNDNETMDQVLGRYLHVGQTVTVAVDSNQAYRTNRDTDHTIDAAVFVGGDNISKQMLKNGDATVRKGDTSSAAILANYGPIQRTIGWVSELVAHTDIPWLSDQFLRVRSPLESYRAEQVYGTPYQSWDHPIDSYLMPAWNRSIHGRSIMGTIGTYAYQALRGVPMSAWDKKALSAAYLFGNRGAFMGAAVTKMFFANDAEKVMKGADIGSNLVSLGHVLTGGNSYLDEMSSAASIGMSVAKYFEKDSGKGAIAGALVGAAYRTAKGQAGKEWIPERTQKKWEMQDYFDRLTYIKYTALYKAAAKKAKSEEGVDVDNLVSSRDYREEKRQSALERFKGIKDALRGTKSSYEHKQMMKLLTGKINALDNDTTIIEGGKYTHSALIYKQAAEATMYALKKGSSWSQIITALPTNDREYFTEFVKERDPGKRSDILKTASPALKKALNLAWGKDVKKDEDNETYFAKHNLPQLNWAGWRPDTDLKNVEVKTIANEGMSLSDFGYYESQLRDPDVINAPSIVKPKHKNSQMNGVRRNLQKILEGQGLKNVSVNVTDNAFDGHQIKADIGLFTGKRQINGMVKDQMDEKTR